MKTVVPPAINSTNANRRTRLPIESANVTDSAARSMARRSAAKSKPLALHALQKLVHDAAIEILAEIRVLDAGVDRRVVVDLDDREPVTRLLEIDAVKAVADRGRRAKRELHDVGRRLANRERLEATRFRGAFRGVVIDLPVTARH